MKKYIVLIIIMAALLSGCKKDDQAQYDTENYRFDVEYAQKFGAGYICIIRDNVTGLKYLFARNGYGGGMTVLVEND